MTRREIKQQRKRLYRNYLKKQVWQYEDVTDER